MKQITKAVRDLVPDTLMLAGIGCMSYGAGLIYIPAGWIVAGGFAFAFGLLAARREGAD
jgi:8-oxo-dGTP pyrophosphatase MutT (NUDIX family)